MRPTILVTGAAGTVGSSLVPRLLDDPRFEIIALIHRTSRAAEHIAASDHERMSVVEGDVTRPDFGWGPERSRRVATRITHICHLAATTSFGAPIEDARRINVQGTQHMLEFAERCPDLEHFALASTVFVSGRRTGLIREAELTHEAGFVNSYEQSKYEAELRAHDFAGRFPISICRISTIFGDSRSGEVRHYTAPHQALRIMSLGLASMLPGTPGYRVNLVPTDLVVDTLSRLVRAPPSRLTTYHLAAPDEKCLTLEEMIDEGYRSFSKLIPGWDKRKYPKPAIVTGQTFDRFMDSVEQTGNPLLGGVMGALRHFAHQLLYPKEFDLTNTSRRLPQYGNRVSDPRKYFGSVLETCVRTNWGSRVALT